MTRLIRALHRHRDGEDEGFALATVLALMLLGAIIVTIMLTATMRTIGTTTATRASVQAKAAAQTGIDDVRMLLESGGSCASGIVTGTDPEYTVTMHIDTGTNASASSPVGCPTSSTRSVLLVATGTADALGTGNDSGDDRTVEALLTKPTDSPTFNKAAFGRFGVSLATNMVIADSTATNSADIFTEGTFTCSSNMVIEGDVYAKVGMLISSTPCKVKGTVLTEGDFTCASGTTIGGDLYVKGNVTVSGACEVQGVVIIGGNLNMPVGGVKLGSSLVVGGNVSANEQPAASVLTIAIGGSLNGGTGWWHDQWVASYGSRLSQHATVTPPPSYPTDEADAFPQLTGDDTSITTGFTSRSWHSVVGGAMSGGGLPDACSLSSGDTAFAGPITITSNTRFDTRTECAGGVQLGMGLWFELKADLVIVANGVEGTGNVKFTSGDGQKHSVYIVDPWPDGATTCSATGAAGIKFTWGTWTQDASSVVLLYSARPISVVTTPVFYGQMYGCALNISTSTTLNYVPVGSTVDPDAVPWSLSYIRDEG